MPRGAVGMVVNVGHATEANEPVYLVDFDGCVVGCLELEIVATPQGWRPETDEAA